MHFTRNNLHIRYSKNFVPKTFTHVKLAKYDKVFISRLNGCDQVFQIYIFSKHCKCCTYMTYVKEKQVRSKHHYKSPHRLLKFNISTIKRVIANYSFKRYI